MRLFRIVKSGLVIIGAVAMAFTIILGFFSMLDRSGADLLGAFTIAFCGTGLAVVGIWLHSRAATKD
jgi:hypothetical protein